jgi:hypothetical protein
MISRISTLLIKSSQLQHQIGMRRAARKPNWIQVLRLQSLKLSVQRQIAMLLVKTEPHQLVAIPFGSIKRKHRHLALVK